MLLKCRLSTLKNETNRQASLSLRIPRARTMKNHCRPFRTSTPAALAVILLLLLDVSWALKVEENKRSPQFRESSSTRGLVSIEAQKRHLMKGDKKTSILTPTIMPSSYPTRSVDESDVTADSASSIRGMDGKGELTKKLSKSLKSKGRLTKSPATSSKSGKQDDTTYTEPDMMKWPGKSSKGADKLIKQDKSGAPVAKKKRFPNKTSKTSKNSGSAVLYAPTRQPSTASPTSPSTAAPANKDFVPLEPPSPAPIMTPTMQPTSPPSETISLPEPADDDDEELQVEELEPAPAPAPEPASSTSVNSLPEIVESFLPAFTNRTVLASPFSVSFSLTSEEGPSPIEFLEAGYLTLDYLEDYIQRAFPSDPTVDTFYGIQTGNTASNDPTQISFLISIEFSDFDSQPPPSTDDIDLLFLIAFRRPLADPLLEDLAADLDFSNPFTSTIDTVYVPANVQQAENIFGN
jgi:hypothetical protein